MKPDNLSVDKQIEAILHAYWRSVTDDNTPLTSRYPLKTAIAAIEQLINEARIETLENILPVGSWTEKDIKVTIAQLTNPKGEK